LSTEPISVLPPSQPFRILCVDDEATGLQFRRMVLERRGFEVQTATSAPQAMDIFQSGNFDLLITDHLLGRNTSYGMIAEMKRTNPHLAVIVLSGMAESPDAQGVDAVLSKADGTDALLNKVEEVMRTSHGRRILGRTARDIEAEKTEALLAALVQSSDDAIFAKTLDARFMSWNRAAEIMYGYKADEVIGKPVAMLLPPDRPNEVQSIMERLRRGEKVDHFETVRRAKDGHLLHVSLTVSPIRDSRGEIVAASTIARNISERKMAEEALRSSERLAVAGRLAATLAHEINNPLESVTNVLYLLARTETWDDNARHFVNAAQEEIEKIRDITRLTLGLHRQSISTGQVSIRELIDNVLALYKRRIESYGLSVERQYQSAGLVDGIAAELRQVFSNLIVNAVDALHTSGSKLVVRVRDSLDWRDLNTRGVRIVIADDGPGIPPASQSRIFEQFYTTKGHEGTGLGLWVTLGIVRKYAGTIRLKSNFKPGRSCTTFSIFLPVTHSE